MRVKRIGVLGAGTMGSGIAQIAALGGFETRLHDPLPAALESGMTRLQAALAKGAERQRWSAEDGQAASARIGPAATPSELADCDLVIEAAPEQIELKRDLFATVAEHCGADAILATNTSSLSVTSISRGVPRPERLIGMHFFNPPALMKLVEVVAGADSGEWAIEEAVAVASQMGKTPIRARDSPGFIANRLARPFTLESLRILGEEIADAATIDLVCRVGGGFRMGPFELIDLIGLDVNLTIARSFFAQGGEPARWRPSPIQERMVADGLLGRKSERGFYEYGQAGSDTVPRREVAGGVGVASAPTLDHGELAAIAPAGPEILPRLIAQIVNEAAFALAEGIGSPADMDTAMALGFNWPCGPFEFADLIGVEPALALLVKLEDQCGAAYAPAPLLRSAAERGLSLRQASA